MDAFEKYQLEWMIAHGHSIREIIDGMYGIQYDDPEDSDAISTPVPELYMKWLLDVGFHGEAWACKSEFEECEGREEDKELIKDLRKELQNCRDELCMRCQKYLYAHKGACIGCRYAYMTGGYRVGEKREKEV